MTVLGPAFFVGITIVVAVSLGLRAAGRVGRPLMGHDTWLILLAADEIKKGHGYNGASKYYLIEGKMDYPPLIFYFLSVFPSAWLRKYNWIVNPALDSINAAIAFALAYFLASSFAVALIAGLVFSFTPVVLEESLNLNVRVFGLILFNLTFSALTLYLQSGNWVYVVPTVACGILVLLSHKFATQVLYPLLVFLAVLNQSVVPLLVLALIVFGAIIFSKGFYLEILRGHIAIIRFWIKHQSQYLTRYAPASGPIKAAAEIGTQSPQGASKFSIQRLWHESIWFKPFHWLLSLCPFNPFALVVVLLPFIGLTTGWGSFLTEWSLFTLGSYYVATYMRRLGHYGNRNQFLEYNALPTAVLCSVFIVDQSAYWKLGIILVVLLLSLIQNLRNWRRARTHNRSDDQSLLTDIFEYLAKSKKDGVICLPASHTYAVPYFTGKRVFYTLRARDYEKLSAFFPVLTVPVKTLSEMYGLHFVIVDAAIVPVEDLDLSGFERVMERNDYVLFEKRA